MVTKNQIKLIKSLAQKKFRNKTGLFVVEGVKGVNEFLNSDFELVWLFSTSGNYQIEEDKLFVITENELKKISSLKTPQEVLAIFKLPVFKEPEISGLLLALDGVRDPGNLGTIVRLCDWFGIGSIICSRDTVDCFNSKVVQASMGSLTRVELYYKDLPQFLNTQKLMPIYGAFLNGDNVYKEDLPENAILVMGNEANGISEEVEKFITKAISIPQFGANLETESLNVATATAILLSEFRRDSSTGK